MDDKTRVPAEAFKDFEASPLPLGPDGRPDGSAGIGAPTPIPPATVDNFVCLRGPCRYYWELVTHVETGNPAETWEALGLEPPRQINRVCLVNPGHETELTDDNVYACNRWDPEDGDQWRERERRRELWYSAHPEHRPTEDDDAADGSEG